MNEKKQVKEIKESEAIMEYLKWRAEDGNKSVRLMIDFFVVMAVCIIVVLLVLWLAGIIPSTEITEVCTVVKTVRGVM